MPGRATVSIIDCGHGNLASVDNALRAIGAEPIICADPEQVRRAEMLVFPGQGSAPSAIRSLRETGMGDALLETIRRGVPSLGICLGMQLALDHSSEGPVNCLGLIPGRSVRFEAETTPERYLRLGGTTSATTATGCSRASPQEHISTSFTPITVFRKEAAPDGRTLASNTAAPCTRTTFGPPSFTPRRAGGWV